jgi:hypothetical protein
MVITPVDARERAVVEVAEASEQALCHLDPMLPHAEPRAGGTTAHQARAPTGDAGAQPAQDRAAPGLVA